MDWSSVAIVAGVLAIALIAFYLRSRWAADPPGIVGRRSREEDVDAEVERDLKRARLSGRPRL